MMSRVYLSSRLNKVGVVSDSHLDSRTSGDEWMFSGKTGEGDFEIWLEDYIEATQSCDWSNEQRAHWFSWFITGAAKVTWQRTLIAEDKST